MSEEITKSILKLVHEYNHTNDDITQLQIANAIIVEFINFLGTSNQNDRIREKRLHAKIIEVILRYHRTTSKYEGMICKREVDELIQKLGWEVSDCPL